VKNILATVSSVKQGGKKEGRLERTERLPAGKHNAWPRPLTDLLMKNLGFAGTAVSIHCSSPPAAGDVAHQP